MTSLPPSALIPGASSGIALDVHHDRRRHRAVPEPDEQVRAAREDAGVRPALGEQGDRLGQ